MDNDPSASATTSKAKSISRLVLAILLISAVGLTFWLGPADVLQNTLGWAESLGPAGPVVLAVIYVIATVCLAPGSLLTLAGGALFGLLWGFVAVTIGANLGAALAFLVGRYLARDWVKKRMEKHPKFAALDQVVAQKGFTIVLLTRLSPVFPFNLLNFMFGVTKVRFRDYIWGTLLGMLPGTLLYVYLGSGIRNLAEVFSGQHQTSVLERVLMGIGLVATLVVTIIITRRAKKVLEENINKEQQEQAEA